VCVCVCVCVCVPENFASFEVFTTVLMEI